MGISDWWEKSKLRTQEFGMRGVKISLLEGVIDLNRRVGARLPVGTNVFDLEWDVLVLLDACRVDSLWAVVDEFDIDGTRGTIWSVGSQSSEWMGRTFGDTPDAELARTAYITANPYSSDNIDSDAVGLVDEVWEYGWDEKLGTTPPRPVTDSAIRVGRRRSFDRILVHYIQPHAPFIAEDAPVHGGAFGQTPEKNPTPLNRDTWFNALKYGDISRKDTWRAYMANLRLVLADVEMLLKNIDAETAVISADHGESFGEYATYGHPSGLIHPKVRRVPWFETGGTDRGTYTPDDGERETVDRDTEQLLHDLGYR